MRWLWSEALQVRQERVVCPGYVAVALCVQSRTLFGVAGNAAAVIYVAPSLCLLHRSSLRQIATHMYNVRMVVTVKITEQL